MTKSIEKQGTRDKNPRKFLGECKRCAFLLGEINAANIQVSDKIPSRASYLALYAQDDWRAARTRDHRSKRGTPPNRGGARGQGGRRDAGAWLRLLGTPEPEVLFVLERLRQTGARRPCAALAFGPGLIAEGAVFA